MRREWLEDMVLMAQKVVQVQLVPLVIQAHQAFRVCQEKEELRELLVPKVTEVASERKVLKALLEMTEQEVFQAPWVLQVLQVQLEKRVSLVLEA